jgi:hypothetical protein
LSKFDQEMLNTRKVPERIPHDRLDWQAHPKSNTIGWNATTGPRVENATEFSTKGESVPVRRESS